MKLLLTTFFVLAMLMANTNARTAEEWKTRSVYQIITDRFARTEDNETPCTDLFKYCGGTFKGIENKLDYIQGMGFDAIWISPVVENTEQGYHGYWVKNLYTINPEFGTEEELRELIQACHDRDIWVMVDVVANHIGYVPNQNDTNHDFSEIVPFNKMEYFNEFENCDFIDYSNQSKVELCWLSGLPDLNQNEPFVRQKLLEWIKEFVQKWNFDALRIDTIPHVSKPFWAEFSKQSGVYTIGEVLNFNIEYLASYQGPVDGVLNYAMFTALRNSFQNKGPMTGIEEYYERAKRTWADQTLLGNFVDNHDNNRFLADSDNIRGFKSALAFSIAAEGIPMVYYGDEHAYHGGKDPLNREAMFQDFNTDTDIYGFLKTINGARKTTKWYQYEQVQRFADEHIYAFSRGPVFFAFTNSHDEQDRRITYHNYPEGTTLCNIFHAGDCVKVEGGSFSLVLKDGETKIFVPLTNSENSRVPRHRQKIQEGIAHGSLLFDSSSI